MRVVTYILTAVTALLLLAGTGNASDRPIAHWAFDETGGSVAHDLISGFNGTLAGSASFVSGGISGNALQINKTTGDLVNMGNILDFSPSASFTISTWIKTTATEHMLPVSRHLGGSFNGYYLGVNNNRPYFYASSSNTPATTTINDGQWHQITAVYDGSTGGKMSIYVNGMLENATTATGIGSNNAPFIVGGLISNGTPISYFTGLIDDLQVYDRPLTLNEVQFLYDNPGVSIPEPASLILLGLGAAGLLRRRA